MKGTKIFQRWFLSDETVTKLREQTNHGERWGKKRGQLCPLQPTGSHFCRDCCYQLIPNYNPWWWCTQPSQTLIVVAGSEKTSDVWFQYISKLWLIGSRRRWTIITLLDLDIRLTKYFPVPFVIYSYIPNSILCLRYRSMKSDRTGARTQTLLELHQMLYHWAIRSSRVSQCDRIPHSVIRASLDLHLFFFSILFSSPSDVRRELWDLSILLKWTDESMTSLISISLRHTSSPI